jgi:YD repeat-containing protein
MRPLPRKPVLSVFAFLAMKNSGPDWGRQHSGPVTARSAFPQCPGFDQRGTPASFPFLKLVVYILLCLLLPMSLRAQTYIETAGKGPTSNAACDANGLTDSFLLATTAGTATTKSVTLNSNGFYAIGFTTPANAPGLSQWQPSTYSLAVENTTTNASVQIFDVCFAQVNSTASSLSSLCQVGSINQALSATGVRTYSCGLTTALATNTTDRLTGILLLKNTVGSRQSVTLKFNTSTDALTVTPLPVPAISSASPASGAAGTAITISGSNFGATRGTGSVSFSGTAASITSWSDTSIVAAVPALTSSGNIVVTSGNGIVSNSMSFTVPAPNISNISPDAARVGASITVGGTNFGSVAGRISFNGTNVTPASWGNTQIVVAVPSGTTTGPVIVTQGVASNSASFTVIPPPAISGVSPASGGVNSQITISGSGFGIPQGSGNVTFNGTAATPFSWSDGSIVVPVPAGATTGPVVVTAGGINSNSFTFTVAPGPSITALSLTTGAAGAPVTISGQNFGASQGSSAVRFNGLPASVTSWTATSIGVTVPANVSTGPVTVSVGQQVSNGVTFTAITSGTLSGTVSSSADGSAISGATIQALQNGAVKASTTTASNGTYSLTGLAAGKYDLKASAASFGTALQNSIAVTGGQTSSANFSLSAPATISGTVTQADGTTPLSGASVQAYVGSAGGSSATTDGTGSYSIAGISAGSYTLQATANGYVAQSRSVTLSGSAATSNFSLQSSGSNPISYVYDELGRLIGVVDAAGDSATYKYDAVGNILSITRQSSSQLAIISFAPQSGTVGATVTISGTAFSPTPSQNTVQFNGTTASIVSASATSLVVTVPTGATTGPISVSTSAGSVSSSSNFTVSANSGVPSITSFTPNMGTPGTAVSITGTNFDTLANDKVTFNTTHAAVTSATSTQIGTTVPVNATSGKIAITTPGGQGTSPQDFYVPFGTHVVADVGYTGRVSVGGNQTVALAASQIGLLLFDGVAGQGVSLQLSGSTFAGCTLYVFAPGGAQITSSNCTSGTTFVGSVTETVTGTYTIGIDPGANAGSINVALTPDISGVITAGTPLTVTTTAPGQSARYIFTGTAGQHVSLSLTNSTYAGCLSLSASILKQDGSSLGSSNTCGSTLYIDAVTLPFSGTYTVLVDPQGSSTGSATLLLSAFNDVTGTITPGTPLTATTTFAGQNALYTFSGSAGQQVSLNITNSTYPGCLSLTGRILNPDGSTLGSSSTCGSTLLVDSLKLATTGTYKVVIDPQGTSTGSANVVLNVFNDITGTITAGTPITATTTTVGQNALYTFSGTSGQQITVNITNSTFAGCLSLTARVLNPDGSTLGSNSTCGSTLLLDSLTLGSTGTYTVVIDPQGTATGSATVLLSSFSDITGTITPGTPVSVTTTAIGQNARYTFTGAAGQQVSINMSGSTYVGCNAVVVSIVKPDGSTLGSAGICNSSTGFLDSQTLPTAGTYTVRVDPQGTTTGSVTVLLNTFADVTGTITAGTTLTTTTTTAGQNAFYTFSGTTGQQVSINLSGSTYVGCNAVTVSIVKPDGTTLASASICNGATGFLDSQTLPTTGTYKVKVDPQGATTGSVTVLMNFFADVTGTITAGTPVTATTTVPGQNALYTFTGTSGQQVSVNLTGSTYTGCNAVTVNILKADGTSLGSTSLCNTSSGLLNTVTLPADGTYTVKIDPQGTTTGSITAQLNNFADVLGTITPGTAVTITTTISGQNARYTFSGTAGQQVSLNLSGSTYVGCNAVVVSILKPDGSTLGSTGLCNTATGFLDSLTLPTTGTYTVFVDPQGTGTGSITVLLNSFADVTGTITAGTALTATTTAPGQNAFYTFSGTTGQQVSINLSGSTYVGCNAVIVSIVKPDGTTLASAGICNGSTGYLDSQTLPTSGTYKVKVDPQGTTTGSVTLLMNSFADVSGTISAGTALTTTTTTPGQNALYTFSGTTGQQVSINMSGSTYVGCNAVVVSILKPDNTTLGSAGICNSSTGFLDSLTLPTNGTYTVKVDPQGTTTGSVTLLMNFFADVTGTISAGTAFTTTTATPGQNALYTFSGTLGQQVSINLSSSTYTGCNALTVSILKPDNTTLASTSLCNTATGFLDSQTLPSTGTYTVKVDPQGATTGSVTVLMNFFADVTGTISVGTALTATTTTPGQNALYTFSGTSGQQLSINLSGSMYVGCNAVTVSIVKPDNTTLASTSLCNTATGFLDSQTLPTTGTYTVKVDPLGTTTGSITVLLNNFGDINGTITPGTPVTATTTTAGQNARYTFSGTAGQQFSINISGSTYVGCNAVVVSIVKPDGSTLGSAGLCNTATGFLDSQTLPTSGTYTVLVNPQGTTTGSITLLLNSFADVTGTISAGTAVTATTTTAGQNALYTFSGTTGQQFSINMSGSTYTGCNAVVVSIVKPDGSNLASTGICNASSGFMDSQTLPTTGTYTVKVDPQGTTTGSVTVLMNSFADVTGTITAGTALTTTTTTAGQNALYTFSGTSGQQFSINMSGSTYTGCNAVVVSILKPDNTNLGSAGVCNGSTGFLDSLTLPTTGTYTVRVDPQGTTTGSVTVLLNSFADVTGTIASGTPVSVTTTTPGQNALYTFSGVTGQSASVSTTGSTYTGCNAVVVSILKPDGTNLGSGGICNNTSGSLGPLSLPSSGTYTVKVDPQGVGTGSATVTLTVTGP